VARVASVALIVACVILIARRESLWDDDLGNLSPIPEAAKRLDKELRNELGAPDVRYLVVVTGREQEEVLQRSEAVAQKLNEAEARKLISGFEGAFQYLPSQNKQAERRAALPDRIRLQKNLTEALRGLPFREGLFAPFLNDVEAAKQAPPMQERDLQGTAFALKVNSLLFRNGGEWVALLPLRGVEDPAGLAQQFAPIENRNVALLDLKAESNRLVNSYRNESLRLTGLGMVAIALVLTWGLRRPARIWRVLKPVFAALIVTLASLLVVGERLNLFHLVSLLLVLGIGLNYSLFFNREAGDTEDRQRTYLALVVCSLTTLSAFGCLAFSQTPVLHAIGLTVSLGAALSLLVSAAWMRPSAA
ncbi:MAG: MMPL family transporter, partial [Burkholderiales bacterium]